MPFHKSVAVNYLVLLAFFASGCLLSGCDGHKDFTKEDLDATQAKITLDKAHEEARKPRPPIDPSLCKDNPEGYLYFKVGDELFRVNKDSPLIIAGVFPELDQDDKPISSVSGIPKGCKGNPLQGGGGNSDFYFDKKYNFKNEDKLIEYYSLRFGISAIPTRIDVSKKNNLNLSSFIWANRHEPQLIDGKDFICSDVSEKLTHCIFKEWGVAAFHQKVGRYIYNESYYSIEDGVPYSFKCDPWVNVLHCAASYRIYPSVKLEYSVEYKNPNDFNPDEFVGMDKSIRGVYELMHVINSDL